MTSSCRLNGQPGRALFWCYCAVIVVLAAPVAAQQPEVIIYYEPHTDFWDVIEVENPGAYAQPSVPPHDVLTSHTRAGSITWNVTYQDIISNTNFGFDDLSLGAARRATFLEVLDYVSSVLNESPATPIDVHWKVSTNLPLSSTLASMGAFYFTQNGYSSGFGHLHITTGTDPLDGFVDIQGAVNFGRVWNSETDNPAGNEFDLYSVLLHEVTHGLGVASLLTSSGGSQITGGTAGDPGKFTFLNRFMALDDAGPVGEGSATALFNASAQYTGAPANLTSNRVVYTGANTVAAFGKKPQIYAPNPFQAGSSLSHWDHSTGSPVMLPSIAAGVKRRAYLAFEVANLVDLGYANVAAVVNASDIYVNFAAGSNGTGLVDFPFDNLTDALVAVADSGTIHLQPGSSSETFSNGSAINQAVTLINENPGGGSVLIGVVP